MISKAVYVVMYYVCSCLVIVCTYILIKNIKQIKNALTVPSNSTWSVCIMLMVEYSFIYLLWSVYALISSQLLATLWASPRHTLSNIRDEVAGYTVNKCSLAWGKFMCWYTVWHKNFT